VVARPRGTPVIVGINSTERVQMYTRQMIDSVNNPKPNVARITPIPNDSTSILITGLEAGVTPITLTDVNKAQETIDVIVQFDVEYLRTLLQRAVPTSNVVPIPGANQTIILTGTVAHPDDVDIMVRAASSVVGGPERVVNALRVGGVQQVQIDVVVARVSRQEIRRMAFDFLNIGQHHVVASTVGTGLVFPTANIGGSLPGAPAFQNAIGTPNGVPSNLFLAVFNPTQDFFGLLQALRDDNIAKVKSEPRLVALSGRPASFLDGGEQAVPVPAGLGQIGVQFEEFGTRLNVLPIVLGTGKIHLEVEPEFSDLNPTFGTTINGTSVPGRTTQRIHTTVELEDGQTYVIGGLIQHRITANTSKVPIVGDLPFLGAAFSRKFFNEEEDELVILVTPHLVDAQSCDQAPKMLPGQETRSPDDFELFLEGILEAPRGPREVCHDHRYVPAYKNGPTAALFPCSGNGNRGGNGCGAGCGNGCAAGCAAGQSAPTALVPPPVQDQMPRAAAADPAPATPAVTPAVLPAAATEPTPKPTTLPPEPTGTGGSEGH
jgi:pilus assembly protein CpaC